MSSGLANVNMDKMIQPSHVNTRKRLLFQLWLCSMFPILLILAGQNIAGGYGWSRETKDKATKGHT